VGTRGWTFNSRAREKAKAGKREVKKQGIGWGGGGGGEHPLWEKPGVSSIGAGDGGSFKPNQVRKLGKKDWDRKS